MEKKKNFKLIVLGFILNEKKKILITQRFDPDIPEAHLKWDVPGGKNEFSESLEETLTREIKEETGLEANIEKMIPLSYSRFWEHTDFHLHVIVLGYICRYKNGKPTLGDKKINEMKWVNHEELQKYEFLPTTKIFMDYLLENNMI